MATTQTVSWIRNAGLDGSDPDADLVQQATTDPDAFAVLYRRYAVDVYRYCYRSLGHREAAEDVTSQTFMRAYASIAAAAHRPFRAWLFAIAHNAIVDQQRRREPLSLIDGWDRQDAAPQPEEMALRTESAAETSALLGRLPQRDRQIIELRLAGLTGQEIADALGCSVSAVRTAQHRAVIRLRDLYQSHAPPGEQGNRHA